MSNKLLRLVEDGLVAEAIELIESGTVNVNECGSAGQNAMHDAAAQGFNDVVDALIAAGCNVNASDEDGMKPLHNAARKGHAKIVKKLLDSRANINDINTDGLTALHFAAHRGHVEVVELLLAHNAKVTATDNYDDMPLHFAASEGHVAVISLLLNKGSPIIPQTNRGNTPLHLAAMKGKTAAVKVLLEWGSPAESLNAAKQTPLTVAENKNETETAQIIKDFIAAEEVRKAKHNEKKNVPKILQTSESEMNLDPQGLISPLTTELAPIQRGMSTMDLSDTGAFCTTPAPRGTAVQGRVVREKQKEGLFYSYYLQDAEQTFLLTSKAVKLSKTPNYPISTNKKKLERKDAECIGKLRGNMARNAYVVYDDGDNPNEGNSYRTVRKELCSIFYSEKYPREITALIPAKKEDSEEFHDWQPMQECDTMLQTFQEKRHNPNKMWMLKNKAPVWYPELKGYILDFYGRVTKKSSKNFQLEFADSKERDDTRILFLFGRVEKNVFTLDYQYPLTCLQAFGIALTAFDTF